MSSTALPPAVSPLFAAWRRLRRNRVAVIGLAALIAIALACLIGPALAPHAYDKVYPNYVKTPPSLAAHPDADEFAATLERIAARMRGKVAASSIAGGLAHVTLESARPFDERLIEYFVRSDLFGAARLLAREDDGKRLILEASVKPLRFLLGTDANGRDLLVRTLIAGRVSLAVGLLASGVALVIGVAWGAVAGYVGGT